MAYSTVKCNGVEFEVDWEIIRRLCLSYWRTYYQLKHSRIDAMSESDWYNPLSWKMPTMQTLAVDWRIVRQNSLSACATDMQNYYRNAAKSMPEIAYEIKRRVEQTSQQQRKFTQKLKDIQFANIKTMDDAAKDYAGLAEASRFVRDTSADIVAIGSTIATGGAASALLGTSSMIKGFGKYQDTSQIGPAFLHGAGSMLLGAFKISGKGLTTTGEYTLVIAQGALEGATSWAAGDGFANALACGGVKVATTGAAHTIFNAPIVKKAFSSLPIPFNIWSRLPTQKGDERYVDSANVLIQKTTKLIATKTIKKIVSGRANTPKPSTAPFNLPSYFDELPADQRLLLNFAIVNMSKGIGHGW